MKRKITLFLCLALYLTGHSQKLIWTSTTGGTNNNGAVIGYDLQTNQTSTIASLGGNFMKGISFSVDIWNFNDVTLSSGGMISASDGNLYGINALIGFESFHDNGGVYKLNPNTNEMELIHYFSDKSIKRDGVSSENYSSFENALYYPVLGLVEANNGKIYGIAKSGGVYDKGGIYSIDISTGAYSKVVDFDTLSNGVGYSPASPLIVGPNGDLYGVLNKRGTSFGGHLYKVEIATNTASFVSNLDAAGWAIQDPVQQIAYNPSENKIYGTKETFSGLNAGAGVYSYNFNNSTVTNEAIITTVQTATLGDIGNGMSPVANDGFHYFTCRYGGANNEGTLVQYNSSSNTMVKVHDFTSSPSGTGIIINGSKIYGTYNSLSDATPLVWSYDVSTQIFSDFVTPAATVGYMADHNIAIVGGDLYCRTQRGLGSNAGSIFKVNLNTSAISLVQVNQSIEGRGIMGEVTIINDSIGYTYVGAGGKERGAGLYSEQGGIAKVNFVSGTAIIDSVLSSGYNSVNNDLKTFKYNALVQSTSGYYYTSRYDQLPTGWNNKLFRIDPSTGVYTTIGIASVQGELYSTSPLEYSTGKIAFLMGDSIHVYNEATQTKTAYYLNLNSNERAYNDIVLASTGDLFITTVDPGTSDSCSIYSIDTTNWTVTNIHTFTNGISEINNGLTEYNGKLYGNTYEGGTNGDGYIFSIDLSNNNFNIEYNFDITTDGGGFAGKWTVYNNKLYAVGHTGGTIGYGTLVELDPGAGSLTVLENLSMENGRPFRSSPRVWDDSFLNIENVEFESGKLIIYPNPSSGLFMVENPSSSVFEYIVYDMQGRKVTSGKSTNQIITIDLSNSPSGMYLIETLFKEMVYKVKVIKE